MQYLKNGVEVRMQSLSTASSSVLNLASRTMLYSYPSNKRGTTQKKTKHTKQRDATDVATTTTKITCITRREEIQHIHVCVDIIILRHRGQSNHDNSKATAFEAHKMTHGDLGIIRLVQRILNQ